METKPVERHLIKLRWSGVKIWFERRVSSVASPGNEVRGHDMNFSSQPLPGIFSSSETVLICFRVLMAR